MDCINKYEIVSNKYEVVSNKYEVASKWDQYLFLG